MGPAAGCFCVTLDREQLEQSRGDAIGDGVARDVLAENWATALAELPVIVPEPALGRIREAVEAIERVVALPGWRERSLSGAPEIALHESQRAKGAFMGYDFHIAGSRLGLIEINTNAGGALMNGMLARAQRACCSVLQPMQPTSAAADELEHRIVAMFRQEWDAAHPGVPLRRVAIVDADPPSQYLYPEFLLFQVLFQKHGIDAVIASPEQLEFAQGRLCARAAAIDLVYNRLTDFHFEQAASQALRAAYLSDAVVVTPHPQAHALYASKDRLIELSDPEAVGQIGVPAQDLQLLAEVVPRTAGVSTGNPDELWARRRALFFKPVNGFAARGAFRGDKLTRCTWEDILKGGYVAQDLVQPGTRHTARGEADQPMKFDLRQYVHAGQVQWSAARMYRGQPTNFRTPGDGFAPVYTVPRANPACDADSGGTRGEHPEYASYVFLLAAEGVQLIPHALYGALARAEAASEEFSGRAFRRADWHVRMDNGAPVEIVREWYGWIRFDAAGRFDPAGVQASFSQGGSGADPANVDRSALPGPGELDAMRAAVFGAANAGCAS